MRQQISIEGTQVVPNQFWTIGCLKWDDVDKIPVTLGATYEIKDIVGSATDIRREKDNTITADIEYFVDAVPPELGATISASGVMWHEFDGCMFVETAILRQIFLTLDVPWAPGFHKRHPELKGI